MDDAGPERGLQSLPPQDQPDEPADVPTHSVGREREAILFLAENIGTPNPAHVLAEVRRIMGV